MTYLIPICALLCPYCTKFLNHRHDNAELVARPAYIYHLIPITHTPSTLLNTRSAGTGRVTDRQCLTSKPDLEPDARAHLTIEWHNAKPNYKYSSFAGSLLVI